jgi:hypothetical protein
MTTTRALTAILATASFGLVAAAFLASFRPDDRRPAAYETDKVFMINSTGSVTIEMFYLQVRSKNRVIS